MSGAPLDDWAKCGSLMSFSRMMSMHLVLLGIGAILGNGNRI